MLFTSKFDKFWSINGRGRLSGSERYFSENRSSSVKQRGKNKDRAGHPGLTFKVRLNFYKKCVVLIVSTTWFTEIYFFVSKMKYIKNSYSRPSVKYKNHMIKEHFPTLHLIPSSTSTTFVFVICVMPKNSPSGLKASQDWKWIKSKLNKNLKQVLLKLNRYSTLYCANFMHSPHADAHKASNELVL